MTDETKEQRVEKAKEKQHAERVRLVKGLLRVTHAIAQSAKKNKEKLIPAFSPTALVKEKQPELPVILHTIDEKCKCKTCLWVEDKILCDWFDDNCMDKKCEDCKEPLEHCDNYKNEKETVKVGEDKRPAKETVQKKES